MTTETLDRDLDRKQQSEWILESLRSTDANYSDALTELRRIILAGLIRSLGARASVDLLEDVTQDSILRILDRLDQFQGRSRFTTWAMSIAIRGAMSELRRRHWKHVSLEVVVVERSTETDAAVMMQSTSEQQLLIDAMHRVIESELTERQRDALTAELRGEPMAAIASRMGCNRNAIYKLTHDARKRLKRGLERAGHSAATVATAFS